MACGLTLGLELEALRRVYRTTDASDTVQVVDEVHLDVAMLPVLPDGEMRAILREKLLAAGWREGDDGALVRDLDGAKATLSPDGRAVTLRVQAKRDVAVTGRAGADDEADAQRAADANAAKLLAQATAAERAKLAEDNVRALAREEPGLRRALQEALNRVYRDALERRARQLGDVESVSERGDAKGSYEVTVVVKA